MRKFKPGDVIEVIDENLVGKVAFAKAETITIITEEGFHLDYPSTSLLLKNELKLSAISETLLNEVKPESPVATLKNATDNKNDNEIVIDLHTHEFLESERYMTNYEKLSSQMERAKKKLDEARERRIHKIIFVHGVGKGVLKNNLIDYLRSQSDLDFYDADFSKYGIGATEVRIFRF